MLNRDGASLEGDVLVADALFGRLNAFLNFEQKFGDFLVGNSGFVEICFETVVCEVWSRHALLSKGSL